MPRRRQCPFLGLLLRPYKCHQHPGLPKAAKGHLMAPVPRGTSMSELPGSPTSIHHLLLKSTAEPPDSRESRARFHLTALSKQLSSSRAASSAFLRQGGYAAADPSNPAGKIGPDFQSLAVNQRGLQAPSQPCIQVLHTQGGDTHPEHQPCLPKKQSVSTTLERHRGGKGGGDNPQRAVLKTQGWPSRTHLMMAFSF